MTPKDQVQQGVMYHDELVQGTDEWLQMRCGLLTASEMKLIISPAKLAYASNDKERAHLYELAAQRITGYVEPTYIGDDMLRGQFDEVEAKQIYAKQYAPIQSCGFITNDEWGFTLGYSPDALVGDDGLLEVKSRRQKFQIETILEDAAPTDYYIQLQTGLLVSKRKWIDFISYSGGLPMFVKRVLPDEKVQAAIVAAATTFHEKLNAAIAKYSEAIATNNYAPTERKIYDITASIGES